MELVRLKDTEHARLDVVAVIVNDHRSSSLMDIQDLYAQMGMEGFQMLVIHALAFVGKI